MDIPEARERQGIRTHGSSGTPSMILSTFSFPTTTVFGAGAVRGLPERLRGLGVKRPLVVTDPGLLQTEAFKTLQETLGLTGREKDWSVFSSVHPNPIEQDVVRGAEAYRKA